MLKVSWLNLWDASSFKFCQLPHRSQPVLESSKHTFSDQSLWSNILLSFKFPLILQFDTFRSDTSICVRFFTPLGELSVYGTVIGIYGNRNSGFLEDLDLQMEDFDKLAQTNNFCIGGDLNTSFSDNYYFTQEGRLKLNTAFAKLDLLNLTACIPQNIDHIILTKNLIGERNIKIETWNLDKKLSDHMGVAVEIS